MTDYEYNLKQKYENEGYRFLYDTIGNSIHQLRKDAAYKCRVPINNVIGVQSDCSCGAARSSRWLMFAKLEAC